MFALVLYSSIALARPNCTTSNCHGNLRAQAYVHAPIKSETSCQICHTVKSEGAGHPKLQTVDQDHINGVCLTCHENFLSKAVQHGDVKYIHSAIEKRSCVGCHDPHGSSFAHLTKENPKAALCLTCHTKIAEQQNHASHHKIIANMENGCLSCHRPHAAPYANVLVLTPPELCLNCHKNDIAKTFGVVHSAKAFLTGHVHEPVAKGECVKCHQVHGSNNDFLLDKNFSKNVYEPFQTANAELCLSCHKEGLATQVRTTTETGFRNGDLNLHALHLSGQKKQHSCRTCHEVHSSAQGKLIREAFSYKDLQLPIRFTVTDQGGKCATACHHEMVYSRERAFKNEPQ